MASKLPRNCLNQDLEHGPGSHRPYGAKDVFGACSQDCVRGGGLHPGLISILPPGGNEAVDFPLFPAGGSEAVDRSDSGRREVDLLESSMVWLWLEERSWAYSGLLRAEDALEEVAYAV